MNRWKLWLSGIRLKLALMGILPAIGFAGVGWFAMSTMDSLKNVYVQQVSERSPIANSVAEIKYFATSFGRWTYASLLEFGDPGYEAAIKRLAETKAAMDKELESLSARPISPEMKLLVAKFPGTWTEVVGVGEKIQKTLDTKDVDASVKQAVTILRSELRPKIRELSDLTYDLEKLLKQEDALTVKEKGEDIARAEQLLAVSMALAGLGLLIFAAFTAIRLATHLARIVEEMNNSSNQVQANSSRIATASTELSEATHEQAAAVEETAASTEEMKSMLAKSAENASQAEGAGQQGQQSVQEGKKAVDAMINAMAEINQANQKIQSQVSDSNQKISEIVQVIGEIANKTKVINEIVFQTKLLSFNASVEAARAGEHGKGFAVVAEEVGNLAAMSGNAAKQIDEMLSASAAKVEAIARDSKTAIDHLMQEGTQQIEHGKETAQSCGQIFDAVVLRVTEMQNMIQQISSATRENSSGVQQVSEAMSQLNQATQQNSASTEEVSTSAQELSTLGAVLRNQVENLVAILDGENSQSRKHNGDISGKPAAKGHKAPLGSTPGKVLQLKPTQKGVPSPAPAQAMKAVSGERVPRADDSRFEEV